MIDWDLQESQITKEKFSELKNQLSELKQRIREISSNLSSSSILHHGFKDSSIELLNRLQKTAANLSINLEFEHNFSDHGLMLLGQGQSVLFYRCIQEIIHNSIKHSQAQNINVYLNIFDNHASLHVIDDGVGIHEESTQKIKGVGLVNLKIRAELLGSSIKITPNKPSGTISLLEFTIQKEKQENEHIDRG